MRTIVTVMLCSLMIFARTSLAEEHQNGWVYPAGSADRNATSNYGDWHGYVGTGPAYGYHVGIDYMRKINFPVQAIAHGVIEEYDPEISGYGDKNGGKGGAILVHHVAQGHDGFARDFYAVYGHMYKISSLKEGDIVEKGDVIGNLHLYKGKDGADWTHLHFGIRPDEKDAEKPFRGIAEKISSDNGWTHPINFLDDNFPGYAETNCDALQEKYPQEMSKIGDCYKAYYIPSNQLDKSGYYIVQYRLSTGGYGPVDKDYKSFPIDDLGAVTVSLGPPKDGYGGELNFLYKEDTSIVGDSTSDNDVHIDKVTASYQNEEKYDHTVEIYAGQEVRMEVDIENKGDDDIRVDIEYFKDDDKNFDFGDSHKVGEDKNIKIDHGKRNNGQYENIIEHKQHIDFQEVGIYYLYIKVTTSGDTDKSSSSNIREYAKVIVKEPPCKANFTISEKQGMSPLVISFNNSSTGDIQGWNWNFGDGTFSSDLNPVHIYENPGRFTPTLSVFSYDYETTLAGPTINVISPTPPSITITNPISGDKWKSDKTKHITWDIYNFPVKGKVKIEYSMNGGSSWKTIDSSTGNDGSKYWGMCDSSTKDSDNSYIRITSKEYPDVFSISQRFEIDHKKGCK